jgi:hypothetical protein
MGGDVNTSFTSTMTLTQMIDSAMGAAQSAVSPFVDIFTTGVQIMTAGGSSWASKKNGKW